MIYYDYKIHPCTLKDEDGNIIKDKTTPLKDLRGYYSECEENDPNLILWGVYGVSSDRCLENIEDFRTKEEAENFLKTLI